MILIKSSIFWVPFFAYECVAAKSKTANFPHYKISTLKVFKHTKIKGDALYKSNSEHVLKAARGRSLSKMVCVEKPPALAGFILGVCHFLKKTHATATRPQTTHHTLQLHTTGHETDAREVYIVPLPQRGHGSKKRVGGV